MDIISGDKTIAHLGEFLTNRQHPVISAETALSAPFSQTVIRFTITRSVLESAMFGTNLVFFGITALFITVQLLIGLLLAGTLKKNEDLTYALNVVSATDPMTGLMSRKAFIERFAYELARIERYGGNLVLILADADRFSLINESFGQDAGDDILRQMVGIFQTQIRKTDYLCRWEGEQFAILSLDTGYGGGMHLARRCRELFQKSIFEYKGTPVGLTVSFGLSFCTKSMDMNECLKTAEQGLNLAKQNGRNRIGCIQKSPEED